MNLRAPLAVTCLAAIIVGCGEESSTRREEPMPVEETVFGDQVEAIQRTEDQVAEMEARKQDLDAQLEAAEGELRDGRGD